MTGGQQTWAGRRRQEAVMGVPESAAGPRWRSAVAGVSLVVVATSLAVGGCGSSGSGPKALACPAKPAAGGGTGAAGGASGAGSGGAAPAAGGGNAAVAEGWTLPGGTLANTRDVASAITSTNAATLGVAWTVPLQLPSHTDGAYATTPVIVNGVVYAQDLGSNVMAISLATGTVQ